MRPAQSLDQLSPADRLFGWVAQEGGGAWRGKVRFSDGHYLGEGDPVEPFPETDGRPMAILGAPKPAQVRFYLGDADGFQQRDGLMKAAVGYSANKKLRGRKVYLHHQNFSTDAVFPPGQEKNNQNRSITGWIPAKKDFFFDLKVENLTREELGALLALLSLEEEQCRFRLGYGKPLGLGSVSLALALREEELLPVTQGKNIRERYHSLTAMSMPGLSLRGRRQILQDYRRTMAQAYGMEITGPEIDMQSWRGEELLCSMTEVEQKFFEEAWASALDQGVRDFSLENLEGFPIKDDLIEIDPELSQRLSRVYTELLNSLDESLNNDFGWKNIPFIRDMRMAMRGFNNAPVTYPRSTLTPMENGFEWFVENERQGKRSLPPVGETLESYHSQARGNNPPGQNQRHERGRGR